VKKFKNELHEFWDLINPRGNIHHIRFNQFVNQPLIVCGWGELRKFFTPSKDFMVFCLATWVVTNSRSISS